MEKQQNYSKYLTRNSIRLSEEYQHTKPFRKDISGISSSTVRDAPDLLIRALAILSDATVRRYAVDEKT